jgi:predicted dehydrogenase
MRYFLGDVERVYAEVRELSSGTPQTLVRHREDTAFVTFVFKNGVVGTWSWGLAAPGESFTNLFFYGSRGSLRDTTDSRFSVFHLFWRNGESGLMESGRIVKEDGTELTLHDVERTYMASLNDEEREMLFPHGVVDGFAQENWEFIEAVRGNRPGVEVDGWEGLRSLAICEAIYESAYTGEPIVVDEVFSGARRTYQAPIDKHWQL